MTMLRRIDYMRVASFTAATAAAIAAVTVVVVTIAFL